MDSDYLVAAPLEFPKGELLLRELWHMCTEVARQPHLSMP